MDSSLGALKVGQATLAGDITIELGACSSGFVLSNSAAFFQTIPLPGSVDIALSNSAALFSTVPMSGSVGMEFGTVGERIVDAAHFGGSIGIVSNLSGSFVPAWRFDGTCSMEFDVGCDRIVPVVWGAAIIIDFSDEPTYPMIVVTEAVEPIPTNTISVQAF